MSKAFGYPAYTPDGVQLITTTDGYYSDSMMNITVYHMEEGDSRQFSFETQELALLLIEGDITLRWEDKEERLTRKTCFDNGAEAGGLHVARGVAVSVQAHGSTELFVVSTENENSFPSEFYPTEAIGKVVSCADILGGTCERNVTTMFDDHTAPKSNLVLGETYPLPGKWCGYPPHGHPQPEVYYYRIDRPEGFGFCGVGDDVYKITDRSFSCLTHGVMHPQVVAPGYQMYIIWVIRHLPGNPWTRGANLPEYQWLEKVK